jgi:hypothetical protein
MVSKNHAYKNRTLFVSAANQKRVMKKVFPFSSFTKIRS